MKSSGSPQKYVPQAFSAVTVGTPASTVETVLKSFTVPANLISPLGARLRGTFWGQFSANAQAKNIRIRLGPTTLTGTVLFATGAVVFNGSDWMIDYEIVTRGVDAQTSIIRFTEDAAVAANIMDIQLGVAANDDGAPMLLELTGQNSVATGSDIVAAGHFVDLITSTP